MDFVIGLFTIVGILVLLYYAARIISKMRIWKKLFILFSVTIIFGLIFKYVKDNGLTSSAEPNVVQAIEKEKAIKISEILTYKTGIEFITLRISNAK